MSTAPKKFNVMCLALCSAAALSAVGIAINQCVNSTHEYLRINHENYLHTAAR